MEQNIKMRTILILAIVSMIIFTLGCNYEYGSYGKDKSEEKTTESVSGAEMPTPEN